MGIDVAKARLDVSLSCPAQTLSVGNDAAGVARLTATRQAAAPALIVWEATGGWERALVAEWLVAGLPVAVVNPRQVRRFAEALGVRAKTDRLDARVLARFAAANRPTVAAGGGAGRSMGPSTAVGREVDYGNPSSETDPADGRAAGSPGP